MRFYLLRRALQAVFVLWATFTATFVILFLLPSNPVAIMLSSSGEGAQADPAQVAELTARYGFDKPIWQQYLTRLWDALHGDFGSSIQTGQSVTGSIVTALPATLGLASIALALAIVLGSALALVATFVRARWPRQVLLALPPFGVSVPTFWTGLILLQLVSFHWALLPATGNDGWRALVLPSFTLAIPASAVIAQVLAKSLTTTWDQPFIEAARAKGVPRLRIHVRDVLRNAAIPTLTLVGITVGNLLAGSVVVETVFSRNGIGRLTEQAVSYQDIPVVQGLVVLSAVIFVVVNLVVDLVYPVLDPRISSRARAAV